MKCIVKELAAFNALGGNEAVALEKQVAFLVTCETASLVVFPCAGCDQRERSDLLSQITGSKPTNTKASEGNAASAKRSSLAS
jgi:hypothetical protein